MAENKLGDMIAGALEKVRTLADTDTVVGEPIATESGTTIIPISKVSMGFASGGLDYDGKSSVKHGIEQAPRFGGGGGTGISITPIAFLLVYPDGHVEIQTLQAPTDTMDKVAALVDKAPTMLERLINVFRKSFGKKQSKEEATSEEPKAEAEETEKADA